MTPVLQVELQARLGDFQLDVAFAGTGTTVLFGASGAGKSATLAAVAGALAGARGRTALGRAVWLDSAAGVRLPPERRRIGWVFQDARLFPHLSVRANLLYGARRRGGLVAGPVSFDEVVETLGVSPLLARKPAGLSGGERQRVALGRALLSQPELLLLDEPLAALDAPRKAEVLALLLRLKRRYALPTLHVTHDVAEARALADQVVRLEHGRVVAAGPADAVLGPAPLRARIVAHDPDVTWLEHDNRRFPVPPLVAPVGAEVTLATAPTPLPPGEGGARRGAAGG